MGKIATRYDVSDCNTAVAMLEKAGLNWEPEILPAAYATADSDVSFNAEKFRAIVNPISGKVLTFASQRFRPNSHVKACLDMQPLINHGAIVPHGVSVWDGGGKMALQFRCPDLDARIGNKSVVSPLLTLVVNHDSAGADRSFFADFDFWCQNQAGMVAKIQGAGVRHSGAILERYETLVEDRIRSMRANGERYGLMRKMADSPLQLRGKELVSYFARALDFAPTSVDDTFKAAHDGEVLSAEGKVLKAIVADWRADDHGAAGSVWHAYSAITRYTTHTEGRNEATRMQRALLGSQDRYVRAFTEAARLVA